MSAEPAVHTAASRPWVALAGHAATAFLRNPPAMFFTFGFPLIFLILVAAIVGDERGPDGVPVVQFLVAPFAVFGIAQATFTVPAVDMAVLRENGVLMRLRGTPAPAAAVLTARIGVSLVAAVTSLALVATAGVVAYPVEIIWRKTPALLVTVIAGAACLAALGLALASVTRTVLATQALAQGLLIPLAFISDVFIVGARLPRPLEIVGSLLPLKHFARAAAGAFEPGPGYGFAPDHLAVLAAWTVAGAAIAVWRFTWTPRPAVAPRPSAGRPDHHRPIRTAGPAALLGGQVRHALRGQVRDPLGLFFTIAFPVLMLVLFPAVFGSSTVHGRTMAQYLVAGLSAYAVAVAGFVNLPESLAGARAAGVVKRLRGTPLPYPAFLAGRMLAAMLTGAAAVAAVVLCGVLTQGVRLDPARLPALLLTVVAGGVCFAALGVAVVALLPSARSVLGITLGVLLPLCFVSEVFVVGSTALPGVLTAAGGVFPLRHLMAAMLAASAPAGTGGGYAWAHLGVLALWTAGAAVVVRLAGPGGLRGRVAGRRT